MIYRPHQLEKAVNSQLAWISRKRHKSVEHNKPFAKVTTTAGVCSELQPPTSSVLYLTRDYNKAVVERTLLPVSHNNNNGYHLLETSVVNVIGTYVSISSVIESLVCVVIVNGFKITRLRLRLQPAALVGNVTLPWLLA